MKWEKIETTKNAEGTTITYALEESGRNILVQSRKRHIPHANGVGTWDYTSYYLLVLGVVVKEYHALSRAKTEGEEIWRNGLTPGILGKGEA